eukprot:1954940-Lingulodinium_polyedra.AAC.1
MERILQNTEYRMQTAEHRTQYNTESRVQSTEKYLQNADYNGDQCKTMQYNTDHSVQYKPTQYSTIE